MGTVEILFGSRGVRGWEPTRGYECENLLPGRRQHGDRKQTFGKWGTLVFPPVCDCGSYISLETQTTSSIFGQFFCLLFFLTKYSRSTIHGTFMRFSRNEIFYSVWGNLMEISRVKKYGGGYNILARE